MRLQPSWVVIVAYLLTCADIAWAGKIDPVQLVPGLVALIDTSQPKFGEDQFDSPRDGRGIAISPDGHYLYLGYNNSLDPANNNANRNGEVRRFDLLNGAIDAYDARILGTPVQQHRGKSIAVDDENRVYMAEGDSIQVYNADLTPYTSLPSFLTGGNHEGIDVVRVSDVTPGITHVAFTSNRSAGGGLTKWNLAANPAGDIISATVDVNFNPLGISPGTADLGGTSLRGVEVDSSGKIWVVDHVTNAVFRVDATGSTFISRIVGTTPLDIAINDDPIYGESQVLVTGFQTRLVRMFEIDEFVADSLNFGDGDVANGFAYNVGDSVMTALRLDPTGNNDSGNPEGALSGIVVGPRGFYVTNENGQTGGSFPASQFNQKSTYGVTDANSGFGIDDDGNPFFYKDLFRDDNEPVLSFLIPIPEPAAIVLGSMAFAGFLLLARRLRRSPG